MDPTNYQVILQELVRRSNEDARRLRAMEQRLDAVESKMNTFENTNIERVKKNNTRFVDNESSIKALNETMIKMSNNLDKINRQITKFARKQDLKEIERMLDLISPIKQEFVTKGELDELEEELRARN